MTSIRRRTSILVAVTLAVILALGGLVLFLVVRTALTRQFDDGLLSRVMALQSLVHVNEHGIDLDISGEALPRYQPGADAEVFIVWIHEGDAWRLLERAESLDGSAARQWGHDAAPSPGLANIALPDGRSGRALAVEFIPAREHDNEDDHDARDQIQPSSLDGADRIESAAVPAVRLLVAQSREPLDRSLAAVGMSIFGVGVVLVLAGVIATSWAVRRGTRPLDNLSREVATLGPGTLGYRISTDSMPMELTIVVERLNELLARLGEAFAREQRFTGAASHELRTPIAELRMLLEVGLSQTRSPQQWEQTAQEGLGVLDRAQRLCESLLQLSRASTHSDAPKEMSCADLVAILREQTKRSLDRHAAEASWVKIESPPSLIAAVDASIASSILGNLVDNSLQHGHVDTNHPVICTVISHSSQAVITVSNQAPELSQDDAERLFEPFWQKDVSRCSDGGFGLGLAVVKALAESAGGSVSAKMTARCLLVTVSLPRANGN